MKIRAIMALYLLLAAGVSAQTGTVLKDNPATPAQGQTTALLTEQWRAGGDDDEVFFGNIASARVDPQGDVLLLDSQLSRVVAISAQGEMKATLGREGDGPGEIRRPGDMLLAPDGTLCLLQGFPGRIVRIHGDGTPAGDVTYSRPGADGGQFVVLVRGLPHPRGMVLAGIRMSFAGAGKSIQDYFLAVCDQDGLQLNELLTKQSIIDYNDFELSEAGMDFIWSRCAAAADGTVYAAADRNAYRIAAYTTDEDPTLAFTRPVVVPDRTSDQKSVAHKILEGVGGNYPVPPRRYVVEDKPPVITGMWCTDDGLLWVQTSPGINTPPSGCWDVLDVFDGQGTFLRQVALPGSYDPQRDSLQVLRDGRLLIITGALDAFLNQQAVAGQDSGEDETTPLEVICYGLTLN